MKENYTHIAMLLDKSGAMDLIKGATMEGFNAFIKEQKAVPGDCTVTLVQFNERCPYDIIHDFKPLKSVKKLTEFVANGGTPLYDAMDQLIDNTGARLGEMSEADRPDRVLLVILTDGEENASKHATREEVAAKIKHQEEVYSWKVVYIGANQDSFAVGSKMNIAQNSTLDFQATSIGTKSAFASMTKGATAYRCCSNAQARREMDYFKP